MEISRFREVAAARRDILRRRMVSLIAAVLLTTGATTGAALTKGPVLLRVHQDRAALMWETDTEGPCTLHYGKDKLAQHVETTPQKVAYKAAGNKKQNAFIHKVWIENLDAGQTYRYRVTAEKLRSPTYEFRTAPAETDEATFIIYGDTRTHPEPHRKLIELMMDKKPDFVVHVGDFVSDGDKYEQWGPQFFEPVKGLAEGTPMYAIKGNHEGDGGNYERLLIPPGRKNDFTFDYGPLHFFCMDNSSEKLDADKLLGSVIRDGKSSKAKWKFVVCHIPSLNSGHHWSAWGHPDALPSYATAGVDFVMTGHSHLYERFHPVEPADKNNASYVTYITTGGGGAPLHEPKRSDFHAFAKKTYEFCLFKLRGDRLTMEVIDIDGKTIDRIEITKTGGTLNKEYLATAVPMADVQRFQRKNIKKEN